MRRPARTPPTDQTSSRARSIDLAPHLGRRHLGTQRRLAVSGATDPHLKLGAAVISPCAELIKPLSGQRRKVQNGVEGRDGVLLGSLPAKLRSNSDSRTFVAQQTESNSYTGLCRVFSVISIASLHIQPLSILGIKAMTDHGDRPRKAGFWHFLENPIADSNI